MLTIIPQPGKAKSTRILEAFQEGARGLGVAFFGVVGIEDRFEEARNSGVPWFYLDNAYLDAQRGTHFRAAKNKIQEFTFLRPVPGRELGIPIQPWRQGWHVVVCEQSRHFLELSGAGADWLDQTLATIRKHTKRPIRIRRWSADKLSMGRTLQEDLKDAHCVVTHMSAAANEALIAGTPVYTTGLCASSPLASGSLKEIEHPRYPSGREEWLAGLAGAQWTLDEFRRGIAWRALNP